MPIPSSCPGLISGAGRVLIVGIAVAACGVDTNSDSDSRSAFSLTDSAGVELAVTAFSEPVPRVGWAIDTSSELVYGEAGEGDDVHFTWIRAATQLPDGRVAALDPRAPGLFVFAPTGELLSRAGREGDGPGEFRRPGGVVHLGGDTLLVHASSRMRFSLFDTDGNFLAEYRLEQPAGGEEAPRLTMYGLVDAIGDTVTLRGEGFSIRLSSSRDYVWENPTLRYTTDGSLVGEVADPAKMWFYGTPDGPRSRLFGGAQNVMAKDGLVYVSDRTRYEVRVHDPPAGLVRIARLERPRRPVTDEVIEAHRDGLAENIQDPNALKTRLAFLESSPVADSLPWIRDLIPDALGNLWVLEWRAPGRDSIPVGVFSAEGEWLGGMRLPPKFRPLEIGADYVLGVLTDELDVQHLVRYRLERGGRR
ncbi:MAG: hypothetical protein ACODAA_07135 [Gemmatimonadota bacterium]